MQKDTTVNALTSLRTWMSSHPSTDGTRYLVLSPAQMNDASFRSLLEEAFGPCSTEVDCSGRVRTRLYSTQPLPSDRG